MSEHRTLSLVWGRSGLRSLPDEAVCVIVDVLSFSTALVAGCESGGLIYPYRWRDDSAAEHAQRMGARLAAARGEHGAGTPSLSPPSLLGLPPGSRLVLPSPNGSTLAFEARGDVVVAGCLRNAAAVADHLLELDRDVVVVAAGERWPDGSLRVALEDQIGAGAVIAAWLGRRSVAAEAARAVFDRFADDLEGALRLTQSGRELIDRGYPQDVEYAAELNVSNTVPVLVDGAFQDLQESGSSQAG